MHHFLLRCLGIGITVLMCVEGASFASALELHGRGELETDVVFLPVKAEEVRRMLPQGLELAEPPANWPHRGDHPVILQFGVQKNVTPSMAGFHDWPRFFRWNYLEFIVGVPHVKFTDGRPGVYAYMPRLYLNHVRATLAGAVYGFAKQLAWLKLGPDSYEVRSLAHPHERILMGQFKAAGAEAPLTQLKNLAESGSFFEQPLVAVTENGHFICSDFSWNVESATGYPVEGQVTLDQSFLPGLPVGGFSSSSLEQAPYGSFRMKTSWALSLPRACGRR